MFNLFKKNRRTEDLKQIKNFLRKHKKQLIQNKEKIPQDIFDVTNFFFDEVLDIYESMDILIRKDHFRGCLPMARLLLENSINLHYIYKQDTEQRAKNYKLTSVSSFMKRLSSLKETTPELNDMKAVFENELKNYVPDKKTLRDKAEEVNMQSMYKDSYKRLSEYIHSEYRANRNLNRVGPYTEYLKRMVFCDTLLITLGALKSVCEKYDLDGGEMVIDDPGYKGVILFDTNPKKQEYVKK